MWITEVVVRAITPLPLTLAGCSALTIATLGITEIVYATTGTDMPLPVRQWLLWGSLALTFVTTTVVAARWVAAYLERIVAHMSPKQIEEVCADPLMSETIAGIVGPQISAWNEYQTLNRRRLRAVTDEDE